MTSNNDEPRQVQMDDVQSSSLAPFIGNGVNFRNGCDQIEGAIGRFGYDATNPIPVNTSRGELYYLHRLRTSSGVPFIFHRTGTVNAPNNPNSVDRYELVAIDGSLRIELYLDYYHFWRSTKCPENLIMYDYAMMDEDTNFVFKSPFLGTNMFVDGFPFTMATHVRETMDLFYIPELAEIVAEDIEASLEEYEEQFRSLIHEN